MLCQCYQITSDIERRATKPPVWDSLFSIRQDLDSVIHSAVRAPRMHPVSFGFGAWCILRNKTHLPFTKPLFTRMNIKTSGEKDGPVGDNPTLIFLTAKKEFLEPERRSELRSASIWGNYSLESNISRLCDESAELQIRWQHSFTNSLTLPSWIS